MNQQDLEAQRIINQLQNKGPQPAGPTNFQTMGNVCNQCGIMHPPIPQGQVCPMAPTKNLSGITDVEINKFLVNMKNILVSQMQQRNIKNGKKLFQYAIVELTKFLENYNE